MSHALSHHAQRRHVSEVAVPELSNACIALLLLSPSLQPILLNHNSHEVLSRLKEEVPELPSRPAVPIRKIPLSLRKFARNLQVIHQARQSSGHVTPTVLSKRVRGIGSPFLLHGCSVTFSGARVGVYVLVWIEEGVTPSISQSRSGGPVSLHLTPREQSVLHSMSEGSTDHEIAKQLDLSIHTIKKYTKILRLKISVKNRAGLVKYVCSKYL